MKLSPIYLSFSIVLLSACVVNESDTSFKEETSKRGSTFSIKCVNGDNERTLSYEKSSRHRYPVEFEGTKGKNRYTMRQISARSNAMISNPSSACRSNDSVIVFAYNDQNGTVYVEPIEKTHSVAKVKITTNYNQKVKQIDLFAYKGAVYPIDDLSFTCDTQESSFLEFNQNCE